MSIRSSSAGTSSLALSDIVRPTFSFRLKPWLQASHEPDEATNRVSDCPPIRSLNQSHVSIRQVIRVMAAAMFPAAPLAADENAIAYELFFSTTDTNDDADEQQALVTRARDEMLAFAREFTRGFIWQRHQFHLALQHTSSSIDKEVNGANGEIGIMRYYLKGETHVGDEIQDEWVVTALLVEITKRYADVLVRVRDSDGEFLLIECADALPEWVHPENSDGRVLLRDGVLHLVSPSIVPEESSENEANRRKQKKTKKKTKTADKDPFADPTAMRCMQAVLQQPLQTKASDAMQRALSSKLSQVPPFMKENRHRVRCLLPAKAARVLAQRPEVLGAAVEAFYYREPKFATSICTKMKLFSPVGESSEPVTEPIVARMVSFSRCMFAQLKQQQFFAPKPFQKSPSYHNALTGSAAESSQDANTLAAEIGMKLTCGLEILYATGGEDQFGESWRQLIDDTLRSGSVSTTSNSDMETLGENDDDSWLYVHPDSLEEKLRQVELSMGEAKKSGAAAGQDEEDLESVGGAEELENIATMFNNFLGGISGIDGVEGNESIQFDMSAFMEILNGDGSGEERKPRFSEGGEYFYEDDDDDDDFGSSSGSDDSDGEDEDARMEAAMAEMDAELSTTHMAKSFARVEQTGEREAANDGVLDDDAELDDEIAADKPLDLDFNLLSNLLESFASQEGHAGPVSNILSEMNFPRAV